MKKLQLILLITAWIFGIQTIGAQDAYDVLKKGFETPPDCARPKIYYWWLNGYVDTGRIKEEIKAMRDVGITGFDIFEIGVNATDTVTPAGPAFLSPESLHAIKIALDEAGKYGMEVGLNMASSWNAGGSWVTPEFASKAIYMSKIRIDDANRQQKIKLPFPQVPQKDNRGQETIIKFNRNGKPVYYREIAVVALPSNKVIADTAKIIDVTRFFDPQDETLNWQVPEGDWDVYRFITSNSTEKLMLPSPNSTGPIIDHFDADATRMHFDYVIEKLKTVVPDFRESSLKSLYLASYEAKGMTWTPGLPAVFKDMHRYDIYKFLPLLFNKDLYQHSLAERFQADFQKTLSELMINNFYRKAKEIANSYGLKVNSESGGPGYPLHNVPVEPLKSLGAVDIPRGEFWINHNRLNKDGIDVLRMVKEVSAASHIYRRKIVEQEAFTTFQHWQEAPSDMKPYGDRAFCEGMNKVVFHGFTHYPGNIKEPGSVYYAGTHYNDKNIWFSKTEPFNDYLSRVSYILQETDFFADVLYYYGDRTPNFTGHKNSRFAVGAGYDYEVVNTEIFTKLTVENKKVKLPSGAVFELLYLDPEKEMHPEVLKKIEDLLRQGARIIGEKPLRTSVEHDNGTQQLIDKLWDKTNKSGFVMTDVTPLVLLQKMNVQPDISYPGFEFNDLDYTHYQKDGLDFYFVRNTRDKWVTKNVNFRQQNKIPEIWDPKTGEIVSPDIYSLNSASVGIPVSLPPYGATFYVFGKGENRAKYDRVTCLNQPCAQLLTYRNRTYMLTDGVFELSKGNQKYAFENQVATQAVDGAWELFFPGVFDTPGKVILPGLTSWTESENEKIKYYSGTATYKKTFQYDINSVFKKEGQKIFLDLGELSKVGSVVLNDVPLGIAWTKPHWFDVTGIIRPGDNTLVVEVANTWSNRLTGDAITGEKYATTNINGTNIAGLNKVHVPWAQVPLIESGLLGPVTLKTVNPVE